MGRLPRLPTRFLPPVRPRGLRTPCLPSPDRATSSTLVSSPWPHRLSPWSVACHRAWVGTGVHGRLAPGNAGAELTVSAGGLHWHLG